MKSKKKFITGKPRYCQKCGTESHELFEVTNKMQVINQLQYCKKCKDKFDTEK